MKALTAGFIRDVTVTRWTRIGIGADATVYSLSAALEDPYGSPHSFHVFVRLRPGGGGSPSHMH